MRSGTQRTGGGSRGLLGEVAPYRGRLASAVGLGIVGIFALVGRMIVMGAGVDTVARRAGTALPGITLGPGGTTAAFAVMALGLTALYAYSKYRSEVLCWTVGRQVQHRLRVALYDHVQHLEMRCSQHRTRSELASILLEDIDQIERAFDASSVLLQLTINTAVLLAVIFIASPGLGLFTSLIVAALIALSLLFQRRIHLSYAKVREAGGRMSQELASSLEGMSTVRSFTAEASELERLEQASRRYLDDSRAIIPGAVGFPLLLEAIVLAGLALAVIAAEPVFGLSALSLGMYVSAIMFVGQLFYPFIALGPTLDNLARGIASYHRAVGVFQMTRETEPSDAVAVSLAQPEIVYDRVSFFYSNQSPVLKDISLRFAPGRTTAIVGLTGSGKSTLMSLLVGLYKVDAGTIRFSGTDIQRIRRADYRSAIAIVSQDAYMFRRSVLENITIGNPGASFADVIEAARIACAHQFIERLPAGYDTIVGERGETLSGGQRQRIALARAILKDAPVLVLDEATSQIDLSTEAEIQHRLKSVCENRTVIVIAHRLSTIKHVDHIYVIGNGSVEQQGTHEELMAVAGTYQRFWQEQGV